METRKSTLIVGEIGQNHNGSVEIAKLIVDLCARPVLEETFNISVRSMDAVKPTKRDLNEEMSVSQMKRPYPSPLAFGRTYGEHRKFLELSNEQHFEIYTYARQKGLRFVETICGIGALGILKLITPDYLKVASRDLTNLPLLERLGEPRLPINLSTGMAGREELDAALSIIVRFHENISILHCTSEYPTYPDNVNLNTIPYLIKRYP